MIGLKKIHDIVPCGKKVDGYSGSVNLYVDFC